MLFSGFCASLLSVNAQTLPFALWSAVLKYFRVKIDIFKLKGCFLMTFSSYLKANFKLWLCYFFVETFCLCYFLRFLQLWLIFVPQRSPYKEFKIPKYLRTPEGNMKTSLAVGTVQTVGRWVIVFPEFSSFWVRWRFQSIVSQVDINMVCRRLRASSITNT